VVRLRNDSAWMFAPGETVQLPHVPARLGNTLDAEIADTGIELHRKVAAA